MTNRPRENIREIVSRDISNIYERYTELKRDLHENLQDTLDYLNSLVEQIPQLTYGPVISKTPKVTRKRRIQYIETIEEDKVFDNDHTLSQINNKNDDNAKEKETEDTMLNRTRRKASRKAADIITRQQSLSTKPKSQKTSNEDNTETVTNATTARSSRAKRRKSSKSSSDEDESRPSKQSRIEDDGNDTITNNAAINEDTDEPSLYEDAISKSVPVMNSTMKSNSTILLNRLDKMMNVTVVLEPLQNHPKLNETVTLVRKSNYSDSPKATKKQSTVSNNVEDKNISISPPLSNSVPKKGLQDRMQQIKQARANGEFNEVMTDDESSPDIKTKKYQNTAKQKEAAKSKKQVKQSTTKARHSSQSILSSDDEVANTFETKILRERNTATQEVKNMYKTNALFSPYAKESVKKKIEAFEQAGINSPKPADVDTPPRLTRTKTRAMAAANKETDNPKSKDKNIVQQLARKSLMKAKKISLIKETRDNEETKEFHVLQNKSQAQKISKLLSNEKINAKQQLLSTPLSKNKTQLPMSVNRILHTPSNNQQLSSHTKALTASRANIVTTVESFLQPPKPLNKFNSIDLLDEKKKNEEDARRKREEALRLQTEEKRRKRQEKELKNKLAREAKEKQEMEKRRKAEKERQEKAKLAQQMQEKQREEMERKRFAQLQRAQEKEERRKQEDQLRLQRLREQEEAERLLAEQKRKEQEAEKRRDAEARAQQQAAAEALRLKNQMLAQTKHASATNKHAAPTNYILDSEPDEEESDDESRPKHAIPYWAQAHVRKAQLCMQRHIPRIAILKFFDTRKCTPDLSELFQGIDKRRLKRTSSAVWKTPPRYSMMEAM